jgi:hypothetical protein
MVANIKIKLKDIDELIKKNIEEKKNKKGAILFYRYNIKKEVLKIWIRDWDYIPRLKGVL